MDVDLESLKELAGAVVQQAFSDLRGAPGVASEAEHFLRVGLWDTECVWGGLLTLNREEIVRALEERKASVQAERRKREAEEREKEGRWIRFSAA